MDVSISQLQTELCLRLLSRVKSHQEGPRETDIQEQWHKLKSNGKL